MPITVAISLDEYDMALACHNDRCKRGAAPTLLERRCFANGQANNQSRGLSALSNRVTCGCALAC
jgi:hypothetical protein